MEEQKKPEWWPKNPYRTEEPWNRKPENELMWEEASYDILEAYLKHKEDK